MRVKDLYKQIKISETIAKFPKKYLEKYPEKINSQKLPYWTWKVENYLTKKNGLVMRCFSEVKPKDVKYYIISTLEQNPEKIIVQAETND